MFFTLFYKNDRGALNWFPFALIDNVALVPQHAEVLSCHHLPTDQDTAVVDTHYRGDITILIGTGVICSHSCTLGQWVWDMRAKCIDNKQIGPVW